MTDFFAPEHRRRLILKAGKERVIANRHPWIFAGAIAKESGSPDAAIADLYDARGEGLASGLYSPHSQIRMRALAFGEEITADIIRERVRRACQWRGSQANGSARLVNADGDDLSALVIDRYADVIVIEIANAGLEKLKPLIVDTVRELVNPRVIYFKNDLPVRKTEQLTLEPETVGDVSPATTFEENGLRFEVDPAGGQKTGFFLDQRENRAMARDLARDRRFLNLFSYTGAFGVYAAAGGASHVHNVDISAAAIEQAKRNHELNGVAASFEVADAFQFVRQTRERYGFVVCDPPAFAKSRGDVDRAARGYKDVNLFALKLIEPGGMMMTFSCSGQMSVDLFQKVIFAAALDAGRRVSFARRLTAAADHPVSLFCPEGEYLKGFLLFVHE
jgi:23S rRNA (cytosine1962-C5)-methyltransferase